MSNWPLSAFQFCSKFSHLTAATGMVAGALDKFQVVEQNLKSGITKAEVDEMRNAWVEWRDRGDAILSVMQGQILMRK
ncbi:hypothetical protein F5Y16DRAFT_373656 [Xylariaceae sp. FL0255]|nr:hypothetical protein F5Y16DRAFT_373656 [Xylariaceae sp. FL0255]